MKRCTNCNAPMMDDAVRCNRCDTEMPIKTRPSEAVLYHLESSESGEAVVCEIAKRQIANACIWLVIGLIQAVILGLSTWQSVTVDGTGKDMVSVVVVVSGAILMNVVLNVQAIREARSYKCHPGEILEYYESFGTLTFPMIYNGFLLVSGISLTLQFVFIGIFLLVAVYYLIGVRGYVLRHKGQIKRMEKTATGDL